ncbi:hypothetical protein ABZ312_11605 [Streptomyces sp. NPDC006207]
MTPRTFATVEDKWRSKLQPVDGGHLVWTGRLGANGNPILDYKGKSYQAGRIAYRLRTGRDPVGPARRSCDVHLCVAPACVDDANDRMRVRVQLRALDGFNSPAGGVCGNGHDLTEHRRYRPDGKPYCNACSNNHRTAA